MLTLLARSRPCHYAVIVDENKMPPDEIQQLTYNLAYIYARSTRSVSIASPAYYAHHVATRARAHIGSEFDDDGATIASSASSGREEAQRDARLATAREKLRQVHINLEDTMFFMVSSFPLFFRFRGLFCNLLTCLLPSSLLQ